MGTEKMKEALNRYCAFFETLSGESLAQIDELFAPQAEFIDPFNRVQGVEAIRRIFAHLLENWPRARFEVMEQCYKNNLAYLRWHFLPDTDQSLTIEGVSRVAFNEQGRVVSHRDYWDSASELYAKLPVIGAPTRWLLHRSQANPADQIKPPDTKNQPD